MAVTAAAPTDAAQAAALYETTKPGITRLVTITSALGFGLAALQHRPEGLALLGGLVAATLATGLAAAGANTLNQWMERARDARMPRTAGRPLPSGRVTPGAVLACGLSLCVAGVSLAAALVGVVPAALIAATVLSYLLVYTPSKPATWTSTWIGAFPGALPPVIGWSCAAPGWVALADPAPWVLFAIMYVWQIPHFLAIAWMYREDYAAGGYRVLPVLDRTGALTSGMMLAWAAVFLPVSIAPALVVASVPGWIALPVAAVSGVAFLVLVARVARTRAIADARRAFFASIMHLPLLLVALVLDAAAGAVMGA